MWVLHLSRAYIFDVETLTITRSLLLESLCTHMRCRAHVGPGACCTGRVSPSATCSSRSCVWWGHFKPTPSKSQVYNTISLATGTVQPPLWRWSSLVLNRLMYWTRRWKPLAFLFCEGPGCQRLMTLIMTFSCLMLILCYVATLTMQVPWPGWKSEFATPFLTCTFSLVWHSVFRSIMCHLCMVLCSRTTVRNKIDMTPALMEFTFLTGIRGIK